MKSLRQLPLLTALGCCSFSHLTAAPTPDLPGAPGPEINLKLKAPITRWDDALPLGNGLMGGLLWGQGTRLNLSLDRGDLWDERTHGEKEWWKKYNYAKGVEAIAKGKEREVNHWWDSPYNGVTPTKLPAGRLEIDLAAGTTLESFELDLAIAEGRVFLGDKSMVQAIFSATEQVALMRVPGKAPTALRLIPSGAGAAKGSAGPSSGGAVEKLGYPPAVHGEDGSARWYLQDAAEGFQYCVAVQTRRVGQETLIAVA